MGLSTRLWQKINEVQNDREVVPFRGAEAQNKGSNGHGIHKNGKGSVRRNGL